MEPSKENCQEALDLFKSWTAGISLVEFEFVSEFLQAAMKKLPTQAALDKDKLRKKVK